MSTPDLVRMSLWKRGHDVEDVDRFLAIDAEWRRAQAQLDKLRHQRNILLAELREAHRE